MRSAGAADPAMRSSSACSPAAVKARYHHLGRRRRPADRHRPARGRAPSLGARWLDAAEVAAGLEGLVASASTYARWAGTPTTRGAPTSADLASGVVRSATFTHRAMAALAASPQAAGLPARIPGS